MAEQATANACLMGGAASALNDAVERLRIAAGIELEDSGVAGSKWCVGDEELAAIVALAKAAEREACAKANAQTTEQASTSGELGHWRIDLPVVGMGSEKDERFDGVVLLEVFDDENKTTAEDRGTYWDMRDWEVVELLPGQPHWFCRHGYTIDKHMVTKLAALAKCPLHGLPQCT